MADPIQPPAPPAVQGNVAPGSQPEPSKDPNQQVAQPAQPAAPVAAPAPAPAKADRGEFSGMVGRLVTERNALRAENKLISQQMQTRLDTIEGILKTLAPLLQNSAAPGSENLSRTIQGIIDSGAEKVSGLQKEMNDADFLLQAKQAGDNAYDAIKEILSPAGVDADNLSDPDVALLKNIYDDTYRSGSLDYSRLLLIAVQVANKRRTAQPGAPAGTQPNNQTVGDLQAQLEAARNEGKQKALEDIKKLSGVNHDLPQGAGGVSSIVTNDMERRKLAIAKARENK